MHHEDERMPPHEPPRLMRRAELLPTGTLNDQTVRKQLSAGDLERRCAGVYVPHDPDTTETDKYLERVYARAGKSRVRVISHDSAAAVHGLPILDPDLARLHFIVARGGRLVSGLHLHEADLGSADKEIRNGHRVTTLARTVADVAREGDFLKALSALDSGLRAGLSTTQLDEMAMRFHGFVGGANLRDAVPLADSDAANPGESLSRGLMLGFSEIPVPRLQRPVFEDDGELIGYGDFEWEGRVIGEFDGMYKYRKYLKPGESIEDAVIREKHREDRIRAMGYHVMRWTWRDLMDRHRFRALLIKGLRLGKVI